MMRFLLIACAVQFIGLQAMELKFPQGTYGVDDDFLNRFRALCNDYREQCQKLLTGAQLMATQIDNGQFDELKQIIKSSSKNEFQPLIDRLDNIKNDSIEMKVQFKTTECTKFAEHIKNFKDRIEWIDNLFKERSR